MLNEVILLNMRTKGSWGVCVCVCVGGCVEGIMMVVIVNWYSDKV